MSRLEINPAALNELLTGPTSPFRASLFEFAEAVVRDVQANGPVGYIRADGRTPGELVARMRIMDESTTPDGIVLTVGTDPVGDQNYHYAERVHRGHAAFVSSKGVMRFQTRDGQWHSRHQVGEARPIPFIWDAVERINNGPFLDQKVNFIPN